MGLKRVTDPRTNHVSAVILALLPIVLALVVVLVTPNYFAPMTRSFAGWALIAAVPVLCAVGYLLMRWAAMDRRAPLRPIKMLIGMVLFIFPALWIVLLGPAVMVILSTRSA